MTGDNSLYKYFSKEVPKEKINYSYSRFGGEKFLDDYIKSRKDVIEGSMKSIKSVKPSTNKTETEILFCEWINLITKGEGLNEKSLLLLIKRFEVTKKIFESYDVNFRPDNKDKYENPNLYMLFAEILILAYRKYGKFQYLNALLKVNDINIGLNEKFSGKFRKTMIKNIESELEFIEELRKRLNEQ
jgi:hypothetical protein